MKKLLLILLISLGLTGHSQQYLMMLKSTGSGNGFARSITVDHTKVPNTDQTNFPVLVTGTLTYLKTVANGGKVNNSNGYDITFSATAGGSALPFEMVKYVATTGYIEAYVKVTLTTSTDKVFYLNYGNTSISTYQGNNASTWSNSYAGVYHFGDGTTLDLTDPSNSITGTNNSATATTGQVGGGVAFSGSSQYINYGNNFGITTDLTISAWVNPTDRTNFNGILSKTASNQPKPYDYYLVASTGIPRFIRGNGAGASDTRDGTTAISNATWSHIGITMSGTSSRDYKHYLNGATNGTGIMSASGDGTNGTENAYAATRSDFVTMFKGSMDELRISTVARSTDWFTTEYNNQSSPATFYTIGSETAL